MIDPSRPWGNSAHAWAEQAQLHLRHRGSDGQQCLRLMDERCLPGHLRLAILDIEGGAQPISNEDGTVWVVCNGKSYNYVEVREKSVAQGHGFSTRSDAEVLGHLFEEKGALLLDDLEGMDAIASVDTRKQQLLLAGYGFREKALNSAPIHGGKGLAFARELKAILPLDNLDRSLDVSAAAQFLALGYISAPRTHVQGVRKLRAGEAMAIEAGAIYGDGSTGRDDACVDDVVTGVLSSLEYRWPSSGVSFDVFNLGNWHPAKLAQPIEHLEAPTGRVAIGDCKPLQPGDVPLTWANIDKSSKLLGYRPQTGIEDGLRNFVAWYRESPSAVRAKTAS